MRLHRLRRLLILAGAAPVVALTALTAGAAGTLQQQCDLFFPNTPATRVWLVTAPTGERNTYFGGGVVAYCAGQDNQLVADSGEYYDARGVLYLIGNVRYTEPETAVDAARMTYYQNEDRLNAEGNVLVTFANGTTMRGPVADYWRVTPARPQERLIATGRPQLTLVERDAAGQPTVPVVVFADRIRMDGDSLIYASGTVDITRTNIHATGDSAFMDGGREFVRLMRRPLITSAGDQPFTLRGGVIDLFSRDRQLERVVATPTGHATSQDMELFADSIDLRIREEQLERLHAWGPTRARAVSPERDIIADSIDVGLVADNIDEVRATGDAFATSLPDGVRVVSDERDWLQGDTIIARFEPAPADEAAPGDPRRAQARELVAIGEARSWYQVAGEGGAPERPNVNYVRGRRIHVALNEGEVERVTVSEDAVGVYLERIRQPDASPPAAQPPAQPPAQRPAPPPPPPTQ